MKITIEYEVTGCKDCPYLTTGKTYGNDGRDGSLVYMCKKGVYGATTEWGDLGAYNIPLYPPRNCPYFNSTPVERLASKLNKSVNEIERILEEENLSIIDINEKVIK